MNLRSRVVGVGLVVLLVAALAWMLRTPSVDDKGHVAVPSTPCTDTVSMTPATAPAPSRPVVPTKDTPPSPAGEYIIVGKVYEPSGRPAGNAEVTWQRLYAGDSAEQTVDEEARRTHTDTDGRFALACLEAGAYKVLARSEEYEGAAGVTVSPALPVMRVTLRLHPRGSSLAGVVVGGDGGTPVADARVTLVKHNGLELKRPEKALWTARTDDDGRFAFEVVELGTWDADVTAEGYALLSQTVQAGDRAVRFVLQRGNRIAGTAVYAATNRPAPGVALHAELGGLEKPRVMKTTVDASGRFEFKSLAEGQYNIVPADPAQTLADGAVRVGLTSSQPVTGLRLRLVDGGVVRGRVFDEETREGLLGAIVSVSAMDVQAPRTQLVSTPTDAEGRYEVAGLYEGSYRVSAWMVGYALSLERQADMVFAVTPGAVIEAMDLPLTRRSSVWGAVVDAKGAPVVGADINAQLADGFGYGYAVSGAGGRFVLWDFASGAEIYLRAAFFNLRSKLEGPVFVPTEGITLVLDEVADGAIAGVVVDRAGRPKSAAVTAWPTAMDLVREDTRRHTLTDGEGAFLITDLPAGEYQMHLGPYSDHIQTVVPGPTVHVAQGQTVAGLRLVYDEGDALAISGCVTDTEGKPVEGAMVGATGPDGGNSAMTDAQGMYTVLNVSATGNQVWVNHHLYASQSKEDVAAGAVDVDFVLTRRNVVSGQVVDAGTGKPVAGCQVTNRSLGTPPAYKSVTDADGRFQLQLDPGVLVLMASAEGYADKKYVLDPPLEPGEYREGLLIRLSPGGS